MGKRVTRERLPASVELRIKLANKRGELVGKCLEIALYADPWIRWTIALRIAMVLDGAISTIEVKP